MINKRNNFKGLYLIIQIPILSLEMAYGKPIIDRKDRIEMNWTTMKIRYYGESNINLGAMLPLVEAEKAAWKEGLNYIIREIPELRTDLIEKIKGKEFEKVYSNNAANEVASSTYSYDTTYFTDGRVRVSLESSLAMALNPGNIGFESENILDESIKTRNTGIIIELKDKNIKPLSIFELKDNKGNNLYQAKLVAKNNYLKRAMGKWLEKSSSSEISSIIGRNPATIQANMKGNTLYVDSEKWKEVIKGNEDLLKVAKVAIVIL
ncbi:MAG: hypothetical protein HQK54_01180 [Oligoflexales bacterium]|nr:hypothetical protein [Oligoflexales bacterium]